MLNLNYLESMMSEEMKQEVTGESFISEVLGEKAKEIAMQDDGQDAIILEEKPESKKTSSEPETMQEGLMKKIGDWMSDAGYDKSGGSIDISSFTSAEKKATQLYIKLAFDELEPKLKTVIAKYPSISKAFIVGIDEYSYKSFFRNQCKGIYFVKVNIGHIQEILANPITAAQYKECVNLLYATMVTSSYGTKWIFPGDMDSANIAFIPKPSRLFDFLAEKAPRKKHESFNDVAGHFFSGHIEEGALSYYMEGVLSSDEDIFYNKAKFRNGDTNLCFIVGLSGSGKTSMAATMAKGAHDVEHYRLDQIVENKSKGRNSEFYRKLGYLAYDFFTGPGRRFYANDAEIKSKLNLSKEQYLEKITNAFVDFAVSYARSHDDTKFIIEGVQLHRYINPARFRDFAVCIKGTSIAKSMYQAGKRDTNFSEPLKHTLQYAGDDLKLNKWKAMYKDLDASNTKDNFDDDDEYEYDEHSVICSDNDELIAMEAYQRYIESNIELEESAMGYLTLLQEGVLHEANESIQNKVKNRFSLAVNFIARIADRFIKAMEAIVLSKKAYLEKYQNVILNTPWSDSMQYEYEGDYREAVNRCMNFDLPQFNYEVFAPFLREDGYDKLIERFTAGHNFKYDPANQNLAEQFKNYFLALDRGHSKGKFSQLEPKALYSFVHDQYGNIEAKIKKDQQTLANSENAFLQVARKIEREAAQNKQGQQQTQVNPTQNPNSQTQSTGGTTPVKNTGSTKPVSPVTPQNASAIIIDENFKPTMHPEIWQETAPPAASKPSDSNLKITDSGATKIDQNGDVQNKSAKVTTSTDDQDLTNMITKWIKVCQAFTTGKYTAIQKICKDYMDIITAHVKAHTTKDAEVESNKPNEKNSNTNQQQPEQKK